MFGNVPVRVSGSCRGVGMAEKSPFRIACVSVVANCVSGCAGI